MSVLDAPLGTFRVLEPAIDHWSDQSLELLKARVSRAIRGFPELAGETVNVGLMRDSPKWRGRADWYNNLVKFPANHQLPSRVTIWHEVSHIACRVASQNGENHAASSEEFTSILAVSRMPPAVIDEPRIPYINSDPEAPVELYPEICRAALEYREERGPNSHYIKQCREWLTDPDAFLSEHPDGDAGEARVVADGGVIDDTEFTEEPPSYDIRVHRRAQHELDALHPTTREDLLERIEAASRRREPSSHPKVGHLGGYRDLLKVRVDGYRAILTLDGAVLRVLLVDKRSRVYDRLDVAVERGDDA